MKSKCVWICLLAVLWVGAPAFAGDEELFRGLIPGIPLGDEELARVSGRGAVTINSEVLNGEVDLSQTVDQLSNITSNSGITTPIQFVGDNNIVTVNVNINVQIGTVSVLNPVGSTVSASTAVDFTGAIDFGLSN